MEYRFKPTGVCSREMIIETEKDIIKKVTIIGGCHGNTQGISRLVEGMKIDEVIKRLKGIEEAYRLRVGDLRVLFTLENDTIYIDNIIPRGQAYKRL